MAIVLVLTGLPGAGKSTLADGVARRTATPAFAGDWLMGALKPYGILSGLDRREYLEMYYGLLWTLVRRQLDLGQSAIVDGLVSDAVLASWRVLAAERGSRLMVVQCVCSDPDVHRQRVEGRVRPVPGWNEVGWDHVERMRDEFPPTSLAALTLDAVEPLADNISRVLDLFGR